MSLRLTILTLAAVFSPAAFAAPSPTPEALRDAVRVAFEARSPSRWRENVATSPLTPAEMVIFDKTLERIFSLKPTIDSFQFGDLEDDMDAPFYGGGRKYTLTAKPVGVMTLVFRTGPGTPTTIRLPYAKVEGGYLLATLHGERIPWKGPDDRTFRIRVDHTGAPGDISIAVKYNASGVDQEKRFSGPIAGVAIPAQYVDSVTVTRTGDTPGDTALDISCESSGDVSSMRQVYASPKLAKAGSIVFTRKPTETAR